MHRNTHDTHDTQIRSLFHHNRHFDQASSTAENFFASFAPPALPHWPAGAAACTCGTRCCCDQAFCGCVFPADSNCCNVCFGAFFFLPPCWAVLALLLLSSDSCCCCTGAGALLLWLVLLLPPNVGQLSALAAGAAGAVAAAVADRPVAAADAVLPTSPAAAPPPAAAAAAAHCTGARCTAVLLPLPLLLLTASAALLLDLAAAAAAAVLSLGLGAEHTSHALLLGAFTSVHRSQDQEPFCSTSCSAAIAASGGTQPLPPAELPDPDSRCCLCAAISADRLSSSGQRAANCGTRLVRPSWTTWLWYLSAQT